MTEPNPMPNLHRWCAAGYQVRASDPTRTPEWPTPDRPPCPNPGDQHLTMKLEGDRYEVTFYLCNEHIVLLVKRFGVYGEDGFTPPEMEP